MTPTIENVSLVREVSKPQVYFVCSNTKFWIPNPAEFDAMGFRWDKVQIVPDGTLTATIPGTLDPFPSKPFINPRTTVKPSDVHVTPPGPGDDEVITGKWYGNCQSERSVIRRNIMIAGWLAGDPFPNEGVAGPGKGLEDMLYDVVLDADFIDRMYGNDGLSNTFSVGDPRIPLPGTRLPGNPPQYLEIWDPLNPPDFERIRPPVADKEPDGTSRGVTLNSFTLPGPGSRVPVTLHCEQNVWHVNSTQVLFSRNWTGRGDAPSGWIRQPFLGHDDTWWPYNPVNPENRSSGNLRGGDYVLMKGTFWQDTSHGSWEWSVSHPGHDGWVELHPIDWMVKLESPPPHRRKTTAVLEVRGSAAQSMSIAPDFSVPGKQLAVREVRKLIDGRFTWMDTVVREETNVNDGGDDVNCQVELTEDGRFKAVYIVTWQGQQTSNAAFVSQSVPSPMRATQQHEVSVTMKNTGPTTWMSGGTNPHRLGSQNPQDISVWGTARVDVPGEVAPGDEATFRFAVVAPASIGYYNFQWRMLQEAVEWFGDFAPNLTVEVISKGTLNVWMEPNRPRIGRADTYTVRATDAETGADVHGGKVGITNPSAATQVFDVNTPFTFTFRTQRILVDPGPPRVFETIYPEGTVTAPGYDPVDLDFGSRTGEAPMTHAREMLDTFPGTVAIMDADALIECVEACFGCSQSCSACADACLGEEMVGHLKRCITMCLNCSDECATTGRILSRQTEFEAAMAMAALQACAEACRLCGEECEHHATEMNMEHCRVCAEACRRCERACNEVLTAVGA